MFSADRAHSAKAHSLQHHVQPQDRGRGLRRGGAAERGALGKPADLCVQAVLKTPQGQVTAVLGPKTYMTKQKLTVAPQTG
jgi:hypothetical protein